MTTDQATRIEVKLDQIIERLDKAEAAIAQFMTGPGRTILKMFGGK
jgi:hypothetical protein